MPELTLSTIERTRRDIAELRRGLSDLFLWLDSRQATFPHAGELSERVSKLGEFLERLNADLEQQEKERAQLAGLFQLSHAVNSTLDLKQVLDRAMDIIIQTTRAERGFLMLAEDDGNLTFRVARNFERATISSPAFQVSRSIITRVAETGEPVLSTNASLDPRFSDTDSVVSLSLRSIMCTPLKVRNRVIGVVYVDNRLRPGMFQPADLNAVRAFADHVAVAIQNARLYENIRQKVDEISALKTFQDNIFASITSGVVATDLEDRITAFNRAAETIFATGAQQSLGQPYWRALAPLRSTRLPQMVDEVKRAGKRRVDAEIAPELPSRGVVHLGFSVSSLKDANGRMQGVTIVVDDLTEVRQLEATREMFKRYVAPAVVDRLPPNPDFLKLGGNRQEITILFADIRGFTRFSEPLPPEELVDILNDYLAVAADAILAEEGTLDKFMGDAVMGLFNAPLLQSDHALRAARAALVMRGAVVKLHAELPKSLRLHYGIGIHTGDAVVGNIGTAQQMNFTAIGDAVNLAKRLQENAAEGQILISKHTHAHIQHLVKAKKLPSIQAKGREARTEVWELQGLNV